MYYVPRKWLFLFPKVPKESLFISWHALKLITASTFELVTSPNSSSCISSSSDKTVRFSKKLLDFFYKSFFLRFRKVEFSEFRFRDSLKLILVDFIKQVYKRMTTLNICPYFNFCLNICFAYNFDSVRTYFFILPLRM